MASKKDDENTCDETGETPRLGRLWRRRSPGIVCGKGDGPHEKGSLGGTDQRNGRNESKGEGLLWWDIF